MAIKILTKNAVDNTNIDGARANHFAAGMRSGIVKGALNEGTLFASSSNVLALNTCELRISGHQVVIDEVEYKTFTNIPASNTRYSLVAQIIVDESSNPVFGLIAQLATTPLIQQNLFATKTGSGTYQLEIGRFTLTTAGTITDIARTADIITGGQGGGEIPDIDFNASAYSLSINSDPEVNVDYNEETGQYDMAIGIPKSSMTYSPTATPSVVELKDNETTLYPKTKHNAVFDANGNTLPSDFSQIMEQGATLTKPLTVTGGDSANSGKIIITENGHITDTATATLFGISGSGTHPLLIGSNSYEMKLRGSQPRVTYKDKALAFTTDVSNPNLLINGDFQINQRGLTTYEVNEKYTLDHWVARWRNKVSVLSKGIRLELNPEQSGQQHIALNQTIENYQALYGRTLTASVKVLAVNTTTENFALRATAANHSYTNTNNIVTPTEITGAGIYTLTFDFNDTDMTGYSCFNIGVYCHGYAGDYIDIEWVKLEVGSVATPFSPKTYSQELLDCQRYFFEYACNIPAIAASDSYNLYPPISLPTKLRINSPTLTITTPYVVRGEGSQMSGNPTITFSTNNNKQQLELKVGGLGSVFTTYKCFSTHNGTFTLDAEIY